MSAPTCTPASVEGVTIDLDAQREPLTATAAQLKRLLDCIEVEIVPLTKEGVKQGNKVFGAAILNSQLETVLAQTNQELVCPLFHGEVHTIWQWSQKTPPDRRGPEAASSIFLSTHEPCCMCISSIVWAGFNRVYFLFPYELTSKQGIPHDINIMHELWGVSTYRKQNKFASATCIFDLVDKLKDGDQKESLKEQINKLIAIYDEISGRYHKEKMANTSNSLAFG